MFSRVHAFTGDGEHLSYHLAGSSTSLSVSRPVQDIAFKLAAAAPLHLFLRQSCTRMQGAPAAVVNTLGSAPNFLALCGFVSFECSSLSLPSSLSLQLKLLNWGSLHVQEEGTAVYCSRCSYSLHAEMLGSSLSVVFAGRTKQSSLSRVVTGDEELPVRDLVSVTLSFFGSYGGYFTGWLKERTPIWEEEAKAVYSFPAVEGLRLGVHGYGIPDVSTTMTPKLSSLSQLTAVLIGCH